MAQDIKNLIFLSKNKALDVTTNLIVDLTDAEIQALDVYNTKINDKVEVVYGLDSQVVDLKLSGEDGISQVKNGFLIEVFERGSDGKLKKLERETVSDLTGDNILVDGYNDYLEILTDV